MSEGEQIDALSAELERVIDRFRAEYDMTYAATIGTLELIKLDLFMEARHEE